MSSVCDKTNDFIVSGIEDFTPGMVPEDYLEALYFFMRPVSDNVKQAVIKHLSSGVIQENAAEEFGVKQGNISRQVRRLEEINQHIFTLKKYIT